MMASALFRHQQRTTHIYDIADSDAKPSTPSPFCRCLSPLYLHLLLALAILIPATSQPVRAESPGETAEAQTKRLTYEEYVSYAEQAIRSLSAQVDNLRTQNNLLQAQLKGVQDALLTTPKDAAEREGQKFEQVEKTLTDKYPGCRVQVNGVLDCPQAPSDSK